MPHVWISLSFINSSHCLYLYCILSSVSTHIVLKLLDDSSKLVRAEQLATMLSYGRATQDGGKTRCKIQQALSQLPVFIFDRIAESENKQD